MSEWLSRVHPVDREATAIWFAVCGRLDLARGIDTSHRFLYGHRYWPKVKRAILGVRLTGSLDDDASRVAQAATRTTRVDSDQLLGITAVGLKILDAVGAEAFAASPGEVSLPAAALLETPSMVLRRRARAKPEGLFGRFRGASRRWAVIVEPDPSLAYVVTHGAALAPCRGGDHNECLVGVIAGADRLSAVDGKNGEDPYPLVRRACETRVFGRVSVVTLEALLAPAPA